jgi:hypothetical protein
MIRAIRETTRIHAEEILSEQLAVCLGIPATERIPNLGFEFDQCIEIHVV